MSVLFPLISLPLFYRIRVVLISVDVRMEREFLTCWPCPSFPISLPKHCPPRFPPPVVTKRLSIFLTKIAVCTFQCSLLVSDRTSRKKFKVHKRTGIRIAKNSLCVNGPFSLLRLQLLLRKSFAA